MKMDYHTNFILTKAEIGLILYEYEIGLKEGQSDERF